MSLRRGVGVTALVLPLLALPAAVPAAPTGENPAGTEALALPRLTIATAPKPVPPVEQTRLALAPRRPVRQGSRDSLRNGLVIGGLVGAAYGALVVALLHSELSGPSGDVGVILTTTAAGAGIGGLIDFLK